MESCLCTKCLNLHTLYKVIRKHIEGLPYSLTEYLTSSFKCSVDAHLNYPKLDCINNKCRNQCEITDDSGTTFNWEKNLSYYLFGKKEETFYTKRGKKVTYTRTARIDYNDVPLRQVYDTLMNLAQRYLIHRYHVSNDRVYWEKFVSETDQYILWVDYSQNIALTPKFEVQPAHFSGRQHTLHDSLLRAPFSDTLKYIYHLIDDTNHDSVLTNLILRDIIEKYPKIIDSGHLVLRSDNCSAQYKSRFVFQNLLDIARKYDIQITWSYGEPGHGKGLVDAMAWFGAKGPLRKTRYCKPGLLVPYSFQHGRISKKSIQREHF